MAEAIARRDAADIMVPCSAGLAPLGYIAEAAEHILLKNGYSADDLFSKPVTRHLWNDAAVVINMSGKSARAAFPDFEDYTKVEDWRVEDPYGADLALYQRIFEEIQQRVQKLADRLRTI